jgi:hypothetical protein
MHCAVEDGVEYGLQVVWRTGDGAQHFRDSRPLPKDLGQFLLQTAGSSFGRFAGFELVHRRSFPISNLRCGGVEWTPGLGNAPLLTETVANFQCRILLCAVYTLRQPKSGAILQNRKPSFQNMEEEPMDRLEAMSAA